MNRHTKARHPARHSALALAAALACALPAALHAAAVTDGTMGAVQSLSGQFTVPQSLGTLRGNNLFHSFTAFSIASGESATFTTSSTGVQNVLARVTGTQASMLQGSLRLQAAGGARPDFWLMNPNGVLIGAEARFDVPAGLHLSTAPRLGFADGTVWSTSGGNASSLSVAAPEQFGFLPGSTAAALRWQGANAVLTPGSTLGLTGGEVSVDGAFLVAPSGRIQVTAQGAVTLSNGALLAAAAPTTASSGSIRIDAGSLTITGTGAADPERFRTGLVAQTGVEIDGSAPGAGGITLRLGGALRLTAGAEITSESESMYAGGKVDIRAASLEMDAQGRFTTLTAANYGLGLGPGLVLDIAGAVRLTGADLSTSASWGGPAGAIDLRAGSVRVDGLGVSAGGGINSFGQEGQAGALNVAVGGALELVNGGRIWSNNASFGTPGAVQVSARNIVMDGQGRATAIGALASFQGDAAAVSVRATESLLMSEGAQLSNATLGFGQAGDVQVSAGQLTVRGSRDGSGDVTGIFSTGLVSNSGRTGALTVEAGQLTVSGAARISSGSYGLAGAGPVTVRADALTLNGQGRVAGIDAFAYGAGNAGLVTVQARDTLAIRDGGSIVAGTAGRGDPGSIQVRAGTLLLDGSGATGTYTGIGGDSLFGSAGAAVNVEATRIEIREGSMISSSTTSASPAGSVQVTADTLLIDGGSNFGTATGISADTSAAGRGGDLRIRARELSVVNEGGISVSTVAGGAGGALRIDAGTLTLARSGGIYSVAAGRGNAGSIDVRVEGLLSLVDGGFMAANSGGAGAAGTIAVDAGRFLATGYDPQNLQRSRLTSRALPQSGGISGGITVKVREDFEMGPDALLSIANESAVPTPAGQAPSSLQVQAGSIRLVGADITAAATGLADAGALSLQSTGAVQLRDSSLSTSARLGDGGPIEIQAGGPVSLHNSTVTTSVDAAGGGDGGNIRIAGSGLLLASGFVQANTAATQRSGGTVVIDVPVLLPDGGRVIVGGERIAEFRPNTPGFNVIQAVAPSGVSGRLDVTRPELNLSGWLAALTVAPIDFGALGRDVCRIDDDSSFTPLGRGALPALSADPLRGR